MKKNFFKKLSFVLALAMIVSVIAPASGAFAATTAKLNSTSKILYLDKDGASDYDFNISGKQAGWTYKWTSANTKVATVAQNGVTTAVGVGTTTVSVVIKKATKWVATLKASVSVRDNIATVEISNVPADGVVSVGDVYDFNRSFTTVSGSTKKTSSITRWFVDKAGATIAADGKLTATLAGKYVVTARSFASTADFTAWTADNTKTALVLASDTADVTVTAQMTSATQIDIDTVDVKFTAPMTEVAKNISLYAVIGTTEVKVTNVKEVKMDATNTIASVSLYVPFNEGITYIVKYTGMKNNQFVSATTKFEDVVSMKIKTTEAIINKDTKVEVSLLNKDGVDIATSTLLNRVYGWKSSSIRTVMSNDKLYMYNKGDETTVSTIFHGQKWDTLGNEIGNLTASGNIVAVESASTTYGGVKAWTIVTSAPAFSDVKQKLAVNDTKKLFVQLNTMTGTTAGTIDNALGMGKFKFESSDSTVLYVDAAGNLWPVKAGTVSVVVKYDSKVVDALAITVAGERKATSMELSATTVTLSNSTTVNDFATIDVNVKDQLGDDFTETGLTAVKLSGSPTGTASELFSVAQSDSDTVRFNGSTGGVKAPTGTYAYKISANGLDRFVTILVTEPSSITPDAFDLYISNKDADSKVSQNLAGNAVLPTITIDLFGIAGSKTTHPSITGGVYSIKVTAPESDTPVTLTSTTFDLTTVTGAGLTLLGKIKDGTYVVTAYENRGGVDVAIDTDIFTVKDTQIVPVLAEIKATTYNRNDPLTNTDDKIAQACFKVTYDGADKTASIKMGDLLGATTNSEVFVKNVTLDQTFGIYTLTQKLTVNVNLTNVTP